MTEKLFRIVYCSRNRTQDEPERVADEIRDILAKSRTNNQKVNVTGALLYNDGNFAQVLEGPLGAVEQRFEVIQRDPRHSDVTVVEIGPIAERQFANWSMGLAETAAGNSMVSQAFEAVFANGEGGGKQLMAQLQDLVVGDSDWELMHGA